MVKVTKHERLLNVCRNITGGGNIDADAVSAFKSAVLQYAGMRHTTPDAVYQADGEVGVAVRGAWDVLDASNVLKELDDRQRSSFSGAAYPRENGPIITPAQWLTYLSNPDGFQTGPPRFITYCTNPVVRRCSLACARPPSK